MKSREKGKTQRMVRVNKHQRRLLCINRERERKKGKREKRNEGKKRVRMKGRNE